MKRALFFILFLLSQSVLALELKQEGHSLFVDIPEKWQMGKDLFGIPYIFFSPQENGQRSNISFAHTGVEMELEVKALKDNQKDYQDDKKKWAKTHDATILEFTFYKSYINKNDHRVHTIGVNYLHREKKYIENSFYLECKDKIVFSKSLRLDQNGHHQPLFESIIDTLDCGVI